MTEYGTDRMISEAANEDQYRLQQRPAAVHFQGKLEIYGYHNIKNVIARGNIRPFVRVRMEVLVCLVMELYGFFLEVYCSNSPLDWNYGFYKTCCPKSRN